MSVFGDMGGAEAAESCAEGFDGFEEIELVDFACGVVDVCLAVDHGVVDSEFWEGLGVEVFVEEDVEVAFF